MVRRPSSRARAAQWLLLGLVLAAAWYLGSQAASNIARRHTTFGFGFLFDQTNFDIPFRLIPWQVGDTYGRALLVCVLNTLLVSAMSIVAATLLGLFVGIMRLSANWLVRNLALWFIELVRNTPQLVQIIFWYVAVLQTLPGPRQSIALPGGLLLNVRGLYLPSFEPGAWAGVAWPLAFVVAFGIPSVWRLTWRGLPLGPKSLPLAVVAFGLYLAGIDHIDYPLLRGFNIAGGLQVVPELVALWAGLTIYAAAFIAEIVRASILSVHKGQREAALSLGLRPRQVLSKVVLPQALRVMIPPMTSQYLNIIKSSSLGAAVAYPELFQIFAGTVLQQTAREIETMFLLMAIFLSINLGASALMNWYNRRVALVAR
ncbi:MAG TPA: ABC transporter permease subunit [Acetobacteraceae bacterium]|nr:ABC transporter permease subunit [Acetobacteraceae bacterium]